MVFRFMFMGTYLVEMPNYVPLIIIFSSGIYKNSLKKKFAHLKDPLLQSKIPRILFYIAIGLLVVALLAKFIKVPYGFFALVLCFVLQIVALILSFVLPTDQPQKISNDDILDVE